MLKCRKVVWLKNASMHVAIKELQGLVSGIQVYQIKAPHIDAII